VQPAAGERAAADRSYWESRLGEHDDLHGVGYLGLGQAFNVWMYRVRAAVFRRRVAPLAARFAEASVLDVGSGTGFYVDQWRRTAGVGEITGADITTVAVERLAQRFPEQRFERYDVGAPEAPPLPGGYAVITAFDVLFHITDDARYERAFRNVHDLLRPGGHFAFSDNFVHGGASHTDTQAARPLAQTEAAVRAAGLEIVERRPMFVLMNGPVDDPSLATRLWWQLLARVARLGEPAGWACGALTYPVERLLVALRRESPTTELMVCRRP
jgi:SAM-dependent methyltransferase